MVDCAKVYKYCQNVCQAGSISATIFLWLVLSLVAMTYTYRSSMLFLDFYQGPFQIQILSRNCSFLKKKNFFILLHKCFSSDKNYTLWLNKVSDLQKLEAFQNFKPHKRLCRLRSDSDRKSRFTYVRIIKFYLQKYYNEK